VPLYDLDPEPVQETNAHPLFGVAPMESAAPAGSQYVKEGTESFDDLYPVRGLYDAMKPNLYYAYDRCEYAYLPMRT
jgi:hypothetical protein